MKKQISRLFCAAIVFTMAMGNLVACGTGNEGDKANEGESRYAR